MVYNMQSPPDSVRSSRWRWCWSPRSPSSSPPSMSCRWTSWARWDACSLKFQFQLWKTNKTFWKVLQLFWNWTLHGEAFSPHNASFEGNLQQIPLGSKSFFFAVWKIQKPNNFLGGISDAAPHHRDHWRLHNLLLHCWVSPCSYKNDQF